MAAELEHERRAVSAEDRARFINAIRRIHRRQSFTAARPDGSPLSQPLRWSACIRVVTARR